MSDRMSNVGSIRPPAPAIAGPNPERCGFLSPRASFFGFVTAGATVVAAATVTGFFGGLHWTTDLFSHFRVQYAVSLFLAVLVLAVARHRKTALCFAVFGVVNVAVLVPQFLPTPGGRIPPGATPVKAMLMNVDTHRGKPGRVMATIRAVNPDVLLLEEVSGQWVQALQSALTNYPHSAVQPRDDNFGIALFSRLPFASCSVINIGSAEVPSVLAEIRTTNGTFTLLGTHPLPPAGAAYSAYRNEQLSLLPAVVTNRHGPVVVMGDLNATPWSTHFRRLLCSSGLIDSGRGRGIHPTWPTYNFLLRIPLDHFLHTKDIVVTRREVGPNSGSDHYPLVVEFVVVPDKAHLLPEH